MENVQNHKHEQPCSPWHIHCFTQTTILLCFWGEYHRRCTKNNKRIDFHKRNDCRSPCRFFCSLWPLQDINGQVWMSYIPITQSTGLKNYPPKKQKLEVFLPAIMTTCQMTCHCTRSTYTPLYGVGQPLLLSNMQKPAVTSLQVTKSSRIGNYEQIAVIGSA